MRPTPYPKKINPKERVYHHFKINAVSYALFDSEMTTPIAYGSFNFIASVISNLPKTCTIFYFEIDNRTGWRMKRTYNPNKETVSELDKKTAVERSIENKAP